ncbi:hypothetical protein F5Y19DRAFT_411034 [Xylariaceae sp. FL1651]|nr:hypothetical protein F5Y19DRAFT_411034 [Xylariaceae sp. FL1651]
MAASVPNPVTIDRAYFETLVRRANKNDDGLAPRPFSGTNENFISVPKDDYEDLLFQARQFLNLKRSLLGAGVTEEHIATLVQDASGVPQSDPYAATANRYDHGQTDGGGAHLHPVSCPTSTFRQAPYPVNGHSANNDSGDMSHSNGRFKVQTFEEYHGWRDHEHFGDSFTPSQSADGPTDMYIDHNSFQQAQIPQNPPVSIYARICKRTIALCNLPSFTTLGDVTGVVRGGQLLDTFLRSAERIAHVSFVREEDAMRFYEHARKNDLYIKNKRVFIKWADRHFNLPGHVAGKLATGATRNLIIRRCDPNLTEDIIREDLEHIHNLIVIKVEFIGGSCYIKTNSVHNAMFARTCMMSRAKYKGSKIEWGLDECDQPIEVVQKMQPKLLPQRGPHAKTSVAGIRNRFDMLRLDDDDNIESDDKFDTSSELLSTVDVTA